MTNIITGYGRQPLVCTMADSKKGSMGNRIDCATHRAGNDVRASVEMAGLGAATYAGYKVINKATTGKTYAWNTKVNNYLKKLAETQGKAKNFFVIPMNKGVKKIIAKGLNRLASFNEKIFTKLSKTTGKTKLVGVLAYVAAAGLIGLNRKQAYKDGQIDQKYNDIANMQKVTVSEEPEKK